jgi:uncharacterized lipoprotein NlpE involved in copper resistance
MKTILTLGAVALTLIGCSGKEDIVNVSKRELPPQTTALSDADVEKMIVQAAAQRRWVCGHLKANSLVCTQDRRNIHLKVRVDYTKTDFSVTQISENTEDLHKKIVHRHNVWVKKLEKTIMDLFIKQNLKNVRK